MTEKRKTRKRIATVGILGAMVLGAQQVATQCSPAPEPEFVYVGGDEFDGEVINPDNWRAYDRSTYGSGNNELACLMARNVTVSDGTAKITARPEVVCGGKPYTSGFLSSRDAGRYYPRDLIVEMRAKLPHAQGLWPALWLRHRNGAGTAEVDIMEYFHAQVPGRITQTLHLDGKSNLSKRTTAFEAPTAEPEWHTYRVDINTQPDGSVRFTFYVDAKQSHTFTQVAPQWTAKAAPDETWDIAVNLAVGGNWVGQPDDQLGYLRDLNRCAQSGIPPNCTTTGIRRVDWSASTYEVDYVRVLAPNPKYQPPEESP